MGREEAREAVSHVCGSHGGGQGDRVESASARVVGDTCGREELHAGADGGFGVREAGEFFRVVCFEVFSFFRSVCVCLFLEVEGD